MNSSTKWLLIIVTFILILGGGFFLLFLTFVSSFVRDDVEVVTIGGRGDKIAVIELVGPIMVSMMLFVNSKNIMKIVRLGRYFFASIHPVAAWLPVRKFMMK